MTPTEFRAKAYLDKVYARFPRPILVNTEGHEPGFYHQIVPDLGAPYLTKRAYLAPQNSVITFLVDVTGDQDEVLSILENCK